MRILRNIILAIIVIQCLGLFYNKVFKNSNLYKEIISHDNSGITK